MTCRRFVVGAAAALLVLAWTAPVGAVDGVILINQAKALAGGVTPGDAPGFPVIISRPGSYQLSGDLTVPLGLSGIEITTDLPPQSFSGHLTGGHDAPPRR